MYVCHCHGVNDRTIRAAIEDGATTVEELGTMCEAGSGCGGCHFELERILACGDRSLLEVGAAPNS